jgi:2-methylcitrate dehydratase PrpD
MTIDALAEALTTAADKPLPPEVEAAARRTLLNVVATAVGASRHVAVDAVVGMSRASGGGLARVPGRAERGVAPADAALATGVAAHLDDFDDTHLATVIHPGAACLGVLTALSPEVGALPAEDVLRAFAWGCEVQLRLGMAVSPSHYDLGWHITGTCGTIGAATTAGLLLGLRGQALAGALAWVLEGAVGTREGFGSMAKSFHPGRAAAAGLAATRLAASGAPSPRDPLTGPDGFVARLARAYAPDQLLGGLGERFELRCNTFKPYPCGIVTHPVIEAAELLSGELRAAGGPSAVTDIVVRCHPLVPELTGNLAPADGLHARFSTAHGAVAGLLLGIVDLRAYDDEFVRSAEATRLRGLVRLEADGGCGRAEATVTVTTAGGSYSRHVPVARGSLDRPLTDDELRTKANGLIEPVLPGRTAAVVAAVAADGPGYLTAILDACTPSAAGASAGDNGDGPSAVLARFVAEGRERQPAAGDLSPDDPRARAIEAVTGDGLLSAVTAAVSAGGGSRGEDPARAVVIGVEVARRLADLLGSPPDTLALVGSAVAVAAVRGLDPGESLHALGLAATQATTVRGTLDGLADDAAAEVRAIRTRLAASGGVEAVLLAERGFTGPARPLEGRRGLVALLAPGADPAVLVDGLGKRWLAGA